MLRRSVKLFHTSRASGFGWSGVGHFATYVDVGHFYLAKKVNYKESESNFMRQKVGLPIPDDALLFPLKLQEHIRAARLTSFLFG